MQASSRVNMRRRQQSAHRWRQQSDRRVYAFQRSRQEEAKQLAEAHQRLIDFLKRLA